MIRVYRRPPNDGSGLSDSRPWNVANIPEDRGRESCYETWSDAMAWALTPPLDRKRKIDADNAMDGGW